MYTRQEHFQKRSSIFKLPRTSIDWSLSHLFFGGQKKNITKPPTTDRKEKTFQRPGGFELLESEAVVSLKARRGGGAKPPFVPREVRCVFFWLDGWMDFLMLFFLGGRLKRGMWDCFWTVKWCFFVGCLEFGVGWVVFWVWVFGCMFSCGCVVCWPLTANYCKYYLVNYFNVNVNVSLWITVVSA